jgi:RNA recognition motif. (a.k.a. RRM, RBD, or RNP domain)
VLFVFCFFLTAGYGFVDYDSVQAAEAAIKALQSTGIQAQMAKVRRRVCVYICRCLQSLFSESVLFIYRYTAVF